MAALTLSTAGFLLAIGFVGYTIANLSGYRGAAVVAAVLIVGVGAGITADGLRYQSGEVQINESANKTVTEFQYQTTDTPRNLPVGSLVMLLGATFTLRSINRAGGG
jgi:hypothetical protein